MDGNFIYGEPIGPRVTGVLPVDDYKLLLEFNNGEKRMFDAKPLLSIKTFHPLINKEFFLSVKAKYGTVIWSDDIDYCPDTLYNESTEQHLN
jgi:hypothetical protein